MPGIRAEVKPRRPGGTGLRVASQGVFGTGSEAKLGPSEPLPTAGGANRIGGSAQRDVRKALQITQALRNPPFAEVPLQQRVCQRIGTEVR
ncbi:MAG: hypothetical protein VCB42_12095 [Myxococcota bacterium]